MKAFDFGSDEIFIQKYNELKSAQKVADYYGCSKKTVLTHAKKIGYDNSNHKEIKLPQEKLKEIIADYEQLGTLKKVAEKYGCSGTAVRNFLKKNNYLIESSFEKNAKIAKISKEEFIESYNELKNAKKMGEKYNCSATAVLNYAKKIGYDVESCKDYKLSPQDKEEICKMYNTHTSNELAEKFKVSRGMITKLWLDAGLSGKEKIQKHTTEIPLTGKKFGDWTVLEKTDRRDYNGNIYWKCQCKCGNIREISSPSLRNGRSINCGCEKRKSRGEEKIEQILKENNIPFEREKVFETCKHILVLPFDFYVDNKYLIEFDGNQHFDKSSKYYSDLIPIRDNIKNQWCKDNHIPLIRIPYSHLNKITLSDLLLEKTTFRKV